MRKTSKCEAGEKEKDSTKTNPPTKSDTERGAEDGKENGDDSTVKAKRKRNKKHKEKLKIEEEVIPLRVLSKKEWLVLKDEYLTLQKKSMKSLKKCINQIHHQAPKKVVEKKDDPKEEHVEKSERVRRKVIKDALSKVSPVAYIDTLDGDSEGHIRFHTPEGAKAVSDVRAELQTEHSWALETLSGDHEQRYWQKILVDRQVKLNRPREKKRGTEKLISKAEKIILARAKEATKHIRFQED
ncbi:hypothetical protein CesoFtcFv8_026990 [Champsocephalus esox]|uniref:XRRM domain-containing protein n=1 Tax=Champsocephalus esox TaxID=159716 RepID=A0AAN8B065_9TELE|nr:hypothetical protein CesoFtcFv8_026990 [Champsocephalus esox]